MSTATAETKMDIESPGVVATVATPCRHHKLESLFDAALDLTPAARAALLDRECPDDPELRRQVEHLLAVEPLATPDGLGDGLGAMDPDATVRTDATAPSVLALAPGTAFHQYEIIREIDRGGMGVVYLARDVKLGRRVAIKFLQGHTPGFTARLIAEARTTARCQHPNIVVIHEINEYRGHPFMALEFLRGQTLRKLLAKGRIPPYRALQLMAPVIRALAHAHSHHIVHRDLKPENIFVTDSGVVKVLDFGIARLAQGSATAVGSDRSSGPGSDVLTDTGLAALPASELTRTGAIIGTPRYMSPEQWSGQAPDARCDIWATGVMLYEMIVGRHPLHPLRGEQLMVTAILEQPMPGAHDASVAMPPALADVIDACLEKDRDRRVATVAELLTAVEALMPDRDRHDRSGADSPYAGLNAFQEADANRFFGRSLDITTMLARVQDEPLIGVVGPSGVGKSSFVRAGVIPALKHTGETWRSLVIRPGRKPLASLARLVATILGDDSNEATWNAEELGRHRDVIRRVRSEPGYIGSLLREYARKHDCKLILFVDQFEELYTLTPDSDARLTFTNALTGIADDASSPLRVMLSIRSDFLARVAEDRRFMTELDRALYFLVQPDRESLREAVVRPAEMNGYRFETPSMVDHMLDRLEAAAGALPLLQFAASKLWDNRDTARRLLTERSYHELGGVEGALASHANAVLASLSPREQTLVRAIFLQLVTAERTRAITAVDELVELWREPEIVQSLVDQLVNARLLVTHKSDDEGGATTGRATRTVEIVHESLIHTWPMLSHWLDENQEDSAFLDQLKAAARQWDQGGRHDDHVWRGEAAREAEEWSRRHRGLIPRLQREFLDRIVALAARNARRKRALVAGSMVFLALLAVAATVALLVIRDAEQTIREQYHALTDETLAREKAQEKVTTFARRADEAKDQVAMSRSQLRDKNQELEAKNDELSRTLVQARDAERAAQQESLNARTAEAAAREAQDEAEVARREAEVARRNAEAARARLDGLLDKQSAELVQMRERVRELEDKVGKIHDELDD